MFRAIDRHSGHHGTTVVADETNERVFIELAFFELLHHRANGVIHRLHHRDILSTRRILDLFEFFQTLRRGIHRSVHRIESEIQKPGLFFVALNE